VPGKPMSAVVLCPTIDRGVSVELRTDVRTPVRFDEVARLEYDPVEGRFVGIVRFRDRDTGVEREVRRDALTCVAELLVKAYSALG
jgi:hypothetical protein